MTDFLEEVVAKTRERLAAERSRVPPGELRRLAAKCPPARGFGRALRQPGIVRLIAELKQASPSAGVIRIETDLPTRIAAYEKGGAAALSILTEEHFFRGSPQVLELARKKTTLPLLRKDFIIDLYQIDESRTLGADAVLLIVPLLPGDQLGEFIAKCDEAGLDALVEVHDEADLERAVAAGAGLIGINNRNLRTLRVDVGTAERLISKIPQKGITVVVESGIKEPSQMQIFKQWGAHAALVGETLMRDPDAEGIVRQFVEAGRT